MALGRDLYISGSRGPGKKDGAGEWIAFCTQDPEERFQKGSQSLVTLTSPS